MDLMSSEIKKDNEIKRKKNTEKVRNWREKQRLNTEKDEELKKKDRDRKKKARAKLRQEAEKSKPKLEQLRKQKREEMKEGNVLFNNALNTFYLRLYGVRHMVKDHSDSEKGNSLLPHRLLFLINSKGSFICTIPQTGQHIPRPLLHQSWNTGWNEK